MDTDLKAQLIKSVNNIKNKIKKIKNEDYEADLKYKKVFKPITDSLETVVKINQTPHSAFNITPRNGKNNTQIDLNSSLDYNNFKDIINADSNHHSEYYGCSNDNDKNTTNQSNSHDTLLSLKKEDMMDMYEQVNVPFGIYVKDKNLMMGNTVVSLSFKNNTDNTLGKKYMITVKNKNYELTGGLKELLLRNRPNLKLVTEEDKTKYKEILSNTNAHKRDFDPAGQLKGDKGLKYCTIIKPLFSQVTDENNEFTQQLPQLKIGQGLPELKRYKSNTDYIYWDDPNELIERLKLLIASKSAGNSNHDNEIISIIEELKEAGIIKE